MNYLNFDLDAFDHKQTAAADQFSVRVAGSPVGEQRLSEAEKVRVPLRVRQNIAALQRRQMELAEIISLGEELGEALFPPRVRSFYDASLNRLTEEQGLRIRLKLDTYGLAELPWEYVYLPMSDIPSKRRGPEGFLVLNRRISLVRYEILSQPMVSLDPGSGTLRLIALLANPESQDYPPLDLALERRNIEQAVGDLKEIELDFCTDATPEALLDALIRPAQIFHFSGHGEFQGEMSERYGSQEGAGYLILRGEDGHALPFAAQKLALNLTGMGVRLAVLTACEVGQIDAANAWAGVVTALTHAGIPAVVGMQFRIRDMNAIAFSRVFYRTLAAGQSIDAAVANGRFAIFNRGDEKERDWGVPVLYLRAVDGTLFPQAESAAPGWLPESSSSLTPKSLDAPEVIASEPPNGQAGVRRDLAVVKITFDRDMQADKHSLQSGPGGAFSLGQAQVDYDAATRTFTIARDNPTTLLPPNATIYFDANVPASPNDFSDLKGKPAEPYRFSFTTEAEPASVPAQVDKRQLREVMLKAFSADELEILCSDVQESLARDKTDLQFNLDVVGGDSKTMQVLNMITYLERRGLLGYLVKAVSAARPGII